MESGGEELNPGLSAIIEQSTDVEGVCVTARSR
jgi:hypothetical protein